MVPPAGKLSLNFKVKGLPVFGFKGVGLDFPERGTKKAHPFTRLEPFDSAANRVGISGGCDSPEAAEPHALSFVHVDTHTCSLFISSYVSPHNVDAGV